MARFLGSKCKLCRREGVKLFLKGARCYTQKCSIERRNTPPGETKRRYRAKLSDYAIHLREKQKAKRTYGLLEKQFKNYFKKASQMKGVTGENLLRLLEIRLDNTVYRMGYATSRNAARQLVNHGHVLVDGKKLIFHRSSLHPDKRSKSKVKADKYPISMKLWKHISHSISSTGLKFILKSFQVM